MSNRKRVVIGGLGGGGDIGLALILAYGLFRGGFDIYILSFVRCSIGRFYGERIHGSLVKVEGDRDYGYRFFEDKLKRLGVPEERVYVVCVEEPIEKVFKAMDWFAGNIKPACMLHTDLGGDGLVLGYEEKLGSYRTDTVARAALAYVSEKWGIPTRIGIGGLGAEGGGGELNMWELVADLLYLKYNRVLLAVIEPDPSSSWIGRELLKHASSGMLPIYIYALEGIIGTVKINNAYLHGRYRIEPYYKYVFLLDALNHCRFSPLCIKAMKKGLYGIEKWRRKRVPKELYQLYKSFSHGDWDGELEDLIEEDLKRLNNKNDRDYVLEILCRVS